MIKISKHPTGFREEYCASIVRIGEIFPIEGKDRIVKTLVNGLSLVIGKDEFKTGDVAVYCANETVLHELFLHLNSMYEDRTLNKDQEHKGYINHYGRIRAIKLGGVPSYGLLLNPTSISIFLNEPVEEIVKFLEQHVGEDFDEMNGERFVQVYVPPVKSCNNGHGNLSKSERLKKKLDRFKMLIEGSFRFHYDTQMWGKNVHSFTPDDEVDITVKVHGTSFIASNIETNIPTNWIKRMWRKYIRHTYEYDKMYNLVYSSRKVIQNEYINPGKKPGGFYNDDVYGYWAQKLNGLIPEDICIYGEISGFNPKGSSIQKEYDYGCNPNVEEKSKLMVYRVTDHGKELEISDVIKFGNYLSEHLGDIIMPLTLVYHGTLGDLYPELDRTNHWHENLLELMKTDKRFAIEDNEPLCKNKVPREGIVIRRCNDPIPEAYKLKGDHFMGRESIMIDNGEIDMEMTEAYEENGGE